MDEVKEILKKIFEYHHLGSHKDLKILWYSDLKNFSVQEIEQAWHQWRTQKANENKIPQSFEIVQIIKQKNNFYGAKVVEDAPLRHGESFVQNSLISNLNKMKKNMPDLIDRIRECSSVPEKIILCATALNEPNLIKSPVVQMLIKKLNRVENAI